MIFFLKRLFYRLKTDVNFFWLVLIPPVAYIVIMALTPSIHTLSSTFAVPEDAPMALSGTPTGVVPLSTLFTDPASHESFVKGAFNPQRIMGYPRAYGLGLSTAQSNAMYNEALTNLAIKGDENRVRTIYTGANEDLGNRLVFYYSTTLFQRIQEGYKRQGAHLTSPLTDEPRMDSIAPAQRLLWSRDRALPTLLWLLAGVVVLLAVQCLRELLDTSYKSEKQIAEHTQLPLLGSLPNLNSVPMAMDKLQRPGM